MNGQTKKYDLEDRLIEFASTAIDIVETLPETKSAGHIGNQLLRSGTSAAPNYGEAQGAESRRDFLHKMKICLKELRETRIWLLLIARRSLANCDTLQAALAESEELIRIFKKSVQTAEANIPEESDRR